ncbi:MAG: cytochrome c biogenesis protein CcsA [Ardenticatenaceae bacterium]|nr:cytochrome c biogenesis protein CcsA [Ardenticatenaceae bacterium]
MSVSTNRLRGIRAAPEGDTLRTVATMLGWLLIPGLALAMGMALFYAPPEATMGNVYRIFFFHMPSAFAAFAGFFVTFIASVGYLRTGKRSWDIWALSGAELGILFAMIAIITGSFWARPVWNTWWTWDPRLTTTTIMWLTYMAYIMLRGALDDPERRARYAAVMGVIAFINVPLVFLSSRWFRTIHPVLFGGENPEAKGKIAWEPAMMQTLMICMLVITVLFTYLLIRRVLLERYRDRVEVAKLRAMEVG